MGGKNEEESIISTDDGVSCGILGSVRVGDWEKQYGFVGSRNENRDEIRCENRCRSDRWGRNNAGLRFCRLY